MRNCFEVPREDVTYEVCFYGRVERYRKAAAAPSRESHRRKPNANEYLGEVALASHLAGCSRR